MTLAELLDGDSVFVDANVFIYHFGGRSLACKTFLERCARRELLGCRPRRSLPKCCIVS